MASLEEERAALRLAKTVPPERWAMVMAEVERRRDHFALVWRITAAPGGCGDSPMAAALQSVAEDVARGWL